MIRRSYRSLGEMCAQVLPVQRSLFAVDYRPDGETRYCWLDAESRDEMGHNSQ